MKYFQRVSCIGYLLLFSTVIVSGQSLEPVFQYSQLDPLHGNVSVADINGDGMNDIVRLSTLRMETSQKNLTWFQYQKPGTFQKHTVLAGEPFIGNRLAAGDLDNDGDIDFAAGIQGAQTRLIWLENPLPDNDPGVKDSWIIHEMNPWQGELKDMMLVDFNNDGKPDVVARSLDFTIVYIQESPTHWRALPTLHHPGHEGMDVGDLDQDGDPDIVLNGFWYETPDDLGSGSFRYHIIDKKWFNQTEGSWRDNNCSVKVADVTGDGGPDILLSHSEKPGYPISLYTASSAGKVRSDHWRETHLTETFDFCQTLDAADVDQDGDLDILAAKFRRNPDEGEQWMNEPPFPVILFINDGGEGTEWSELRVSDAGLYAGVFGDVGSDGDQDILGSRSYWIGPIQLWENLLSH